MAGFGAFLAFLDSTVVNVAFPSIEASFPGTSLSALSWVPNAYNIVFAGFLVAGGRFSDLIGRRRMFVRGTVLFTLASAGCAVSTSVGMLIAFRVVQGIGCAALVPASLAAVIEAFPEDKATEGVTLWGATAALAAGLGPPIGGALVDLGNWRWAFLINLPLGVLAVALAGRALIESRALGRRRLPDLLGTVLLMTGISVLTLAIVKGPDWEWASPLVLGTSAVAVAVLSAFVFRNARHPVPVLDPALLRSRIFAVGNVVTVLSGAGFYAYGLTHILWLRYVWHYSLFDAGLAVAPGALVAAVAAALFGRVAERIGHRPVVVVGALVWSAALFWYATRIGVHPDFVGEWLPAQVISGIGVGRAVEHPTIRRGSRHRRPGRDHRHARRRVRGHGVARRLAVLGRLLRRGRGGRAAAPRRCDGGDPAGPGPSGQRGGASGSTGIAGLTDPAGRHGVLRLARPRRPRHARGRDATGLGAGGRVPLPPGDAGDGLYVVRSGQVNVVVGDTVATTRGAGDIIGETLMRTMFLGSEQGAAASLTRADVVITPHTSDVGFLEWHQIDVLREAGRVAARAAMPAVLRAVDSGRTH